MGGQVQPKAPPTHFPAQGPLQRPGLGTPAGSGKQLETKQLNTQNNAAGLRFLKSV
jgi:hypothetical protein